MNLLSLHMTRSWFNEKYLHSDDVTILAVFSDGAFAQSNRFIEDRLDITFVAG